MANPFATEAGRLSNVLKQDLWPESGYTRAVLTVYEAGAKSYVPGTVLGQETVGAATPAAFTWNAADTGTIASVTVSAGAKAGVYRVIIVDAETNKGNFTVTDPDGVIVGFGVVATAFSGGGLAFTVTDGTTDFSVGEGFNITVAAGSGKYKAAVETAVDGSKVAAAIVMEEVSVAATTDTKVLCLVRGPAIVSKAGLVLDSTYNLDAEKNAVYAALEAKGIQVNNAV